MEAFEISLIGKGYPFSYSPGHTWFYKFNSPLSVPEIECLMDCQFGELLVCLRPKERKKQVANLIVALKRSEEALNERVDRYNEIITSPNKAEVFHEDTVENRFIDTCCSLALVHNHISYYKGLIIQLVLELGAEIYNYPFLEPISATKTS